MAAIRPTRSRVFVVWLRRLAGLALSGLVVSVRRQLRWPVSQYRRGIVTHNKGRASSTVVGSDCQPVQYGDHHTTKGQGHPLSLNQALGALHIMGGSSVVKCFKLQTTLFIPSAGADVQFGHARLLFLWRRGGVLVQSLPQQIGKEMVIAIPTPLFIQRDDKQVGAFQHFQGRLAVILAGERVAQGAGQPVEDGRLQQESLDAFGLLFQDFFNQIVQHKVVAAGKRLDKAGCVAASCVQGPLQGKGSQLQTGNPAFGAFFQRGDILRRKVQAHHLVEKLGSFGGGKAQVRGAQFGQLAPGAQTGQGQGRVLTGGDDQVQPSAAPLRRQVPEQKGERVVDGCACPGEASVDEVIVVEDQDNPIGQGGNLVDQSGQDRLAGGGWGIAARPARSPLCWTLRSRSAACSAAIR